MRFTNFPVFISECFPDLYKLLQIFPSIFEAYFTADSATVCVEKSVEISFHDSLFESCFGSSLLIRNISLLPFQLLGLLIGIGGYYKIKRTDPLSLSYSHALLNFGAMNFSSIFAHNIFEPHSRYWALAVAVDVAFTCASCLCLLFIVSNGFGINVPRNIIRYTSAACIAFRLSTEMPFIAELMYLGTLGVAGVLLFAYYSYKYFHSREYISAMSFGIFGISMSMLAIHFEKEVCNLTADLFNSIVAVFFGCSIAFISILLFYRLDKNPPSSSGIGITTNNKSK
jgi:hypothetical protein